VQGREVELTLAFSRDDLARLRAWPRLGTAKRPDELDSTYYDTADLRLRRAGAELRVRRVGQRFVQTMKTIGKNVGGIRQRGEWESSVAAMSPDIAALDNEEAVQILDGIRASDLQPIFQSRVRRIRQSIDVTEGEPARVEIAVDEGEILTAGGLAVPISGVELELMEGGPEALYLLASELRQLAPVQLESRSEADRGYALLGAEPGDAVSAPDLTLPPEMTVEEVLAAIIQHCLAHLRANERVIAVGESPRAVHQMRVSMRRLRSGLQLFRKQIPETDYRHFEGEIRWLGERLGEVRNWDVFRAETLQRAAPALEEAECTALDAGAALRRDRLFAELRATIASPRYAALVLDLGAWTTRRGWRNQPVDEKTARLFLPIGEVAGEILDRRRRTARKRGARFAKLGAGERHKLRIALKKLRYTGEFLLCLYDEKKARRYLKRASALQDRLGTANDVATAERLVQELGADGDATLAQAAGKLLGWHRRGLADADDGIRREWRHFRAAQPFWRKHKS
jgi:inorganic triphosphatase YgiF